MKTKQVSIQLTVPKIFKEEVQEMAQSYGLPLSTYIRYILFKHLEAKRNQLIPTMTASQKTNQAISQGEKELQEGKTISISPHQLEKHLKNLVT